MTAAEHRESLRQSLMPHVGSAWVIFMGQVDVLMRKAAEEERAACIQVARDIEAGAGIVNDAEGHPVCEHCCQECLAGRIADAIAARNDA